MGEYCRHGRDRFVHPSYALIRFEFIRKPSDNGRNRRKMLLEEAGGPGASSAVMGGGADGVEA